MLTIRLFGVFEVAKNGKKVSGINASKDKWLIALLALQHGEQVLRKQLAHTLWPDESDKQADDYLRRSLMRIRKALGEDKDCIIGNQAKPLWLALNTNTVEIDVVIFDQTVNRNETTVLEQAVSLRERGSLLVECTEGWVVSEREKRERQYTTALGKLAEEALVRNEYARAASFQKQAVAVEPLSERAYRGLMETYLKSGEVNLALQTYQELRETQRSNNIGWQPSTPTEELYRRLREELKRRDTLSASAFTSPSVSTATALERHIPSPPTKLVGRRRERTEIERYMETPGVVTLIGPGGVGKTRLAIEVGAEVAERYAVNAWFVDFASLSEGALIGPKVLSDLNILRQGGTSEIAMVINFLRPRHGVLILDNCEQVLDRCQQFVDALQRQCPYLRILVTSREPLHLNSEREYPLTALTLPDVETRVYTPAELKEYEAVDLFIERAVATQPDFEVTTDNADAIARLCCRLGGLPLAIELAAVWVKTLSPQQIAKRLDRRFQLLTGGKRGELTRWNNLREMVDASYRRLSPREQQFLWRLSVFSGGCTLEVAEIFFHDKIGERDQDVLQLLSTLVDKNLLQRKKDVRGQLRFALHTAIQEYCEEILSGNPEEVSLRRWHTEICVELAEPCDLETGKIAPREAMARLLSDQANFHAALSWCSTNSMFAELGLQLALRLAGFWERVGYFREGRALLRSLLTAAVDVDPRLRGAALRELGVFAWRQGDLQQAQQYLQASLTLLEKPEDDMQRARVLTNLGHVAREQEHYEEALVFYRESLDIARVREDQQRQAINLSSMGLVELEKSNTDYAVARGYFEQALAIHRGLGSKKSMADVSSNLAWVELEVGNRQEAKELYEQARLLYEEVYDEVGLARLYHNLGRLTRTEDDIRVPLTSYQEGLRRFRALGMKRDTAFAIVEIAALHVRDAPEFAVKLFGAVRALYEEIGINAPDLNFDGNDPDITDARNKLDTTTFMTAWEKGRQMTIDEAINLALENSQAGDNQNPGASVISQSVP